MEAQTINDKHIIEMITRVRAKASEVFITAWVRQHLAHDVDAAIAFHERAQYRDSEFAVEFFQRGIACAHCAQAWHADACEKVTASVQRVFLTDRHAD